MFLQYPLTLLLLLFCANTTGRILDDFSIRYLNNFGNLRSGMGKVQVNVTYPRHGIYIPGKNDFLIEEFASHRQHYDVSHKYLRIKYTAFSSGSRPIMFLGRPRPPPYDYILYFNRSNLLSVPFKKGHHQVIIIPFSYFITMNYANLKKGMAIGIGGPLFVHRVELIEAWEHDDTAVIHPQYLTLNGLGVRLVPGASCLRRPESSPTHQFLEYMHPDSHIPFFNQNNLGSRRGGMGIDKAMNGIHIDSNGILFENLTDGSLKINIYSHILRLQLSTRQPTHIRIRIQYYGITTSSMYQLVVPECDDKPVDVVFSDFSSIPDRNLQRIWISGPITIHRISVVEQLTSSRIINSSDDLYPQPKRARISNIQQTRSLLVDDLSDWPDYLESTEMVIYYEQHSNDFDVQPFDADGNQPGLGLNSLNCPCFGRGVSIADGGIHLSNNGFIYEQLALGNRVFDLSHTYFEIEYSTQFAVTCKLQILSVIPNNTDSKYIIQPVNFKLNFEPGNHKTLMINVGECGPSFAFTLSGQGTVTLHQIRLHIPVAGQQVLVDDFMDWPLLDADQSIYVSTLPVSIANGPDTDSQSMSIDQYFDWPSHQTDPIVTDHSMSNSFGTILDEFRNSGPKLSVFDYLQIRIDQKPVLFNACYLAGHGVGISSTGRLSQPLFNIKGSYIIMTYSAAFIGSRKIVYSTLSGDSVCYDTKHVILNVGMFQKVMIPTPSYNTDFVSSIGIHIHGPLILHQIEFVDQAEPIDYSPGQSGSSALLIDDFSTWVVDPPRPYNLDHDLYTPGPNRFGSVTLHSNDQYLIEGFPSQLSLNTWFMAIRITYTTAYPILCRMAVFPEQINPQGGHNPYHYISVNYQQIQFSAGTRSQQDISMEYLTLNINHAVLRGLIIHGPGEDGDSRIHPLTIHRIELMANPLYSEPIRSTPGFLPFHWTGRHIPVQGQIGVPFHILGKFRNLGLNVDLNKFLYKVNVLHTNLDAIKRKGGITLTVKRGHILRDTCVLIKLDPIHLHKKFKLKFKEEIGQDYGGLSKEFFTLVSKAIKDPNYALFTATPDSDYALHINPDSLVHGEVLLDQFRIIGRIIGMSILSHNLMDIRLVPSLYRKLIGAEMSTKDTGLPDLIDEQVPDISELEKIDKSLFQMLSWLLQTDISIPIYDLALTMSLEWHHFGAVKTVDLVKNGRHIKVTQSNKNQFVKEYANWHMIGKVEAQANALRDGVWDVVPQSYLASFDAIELELLISGTSTIDIDDWESNTSYINPYSSECVYSPESPTVKHFWGCIKGWNAEEHAKLLVFVTGSPHLPIGGFNDLKPRFTIIPIDKINLHPQSSTCINTLKLPPYEDERTLCEQLAVAILPETGLFLFA